MQHGQQNNHTKQETQMEMKPTIHPSMHQSIIHSISGYISPLLLLLHGAHEDPALQGRSAGVLMVCCQVCVVP